VRLLVIGPPGSGKLSLISVLSKALDPGIRLIVFDLEAEPEVQDLTLESLASHLGGRPNSKSVSRPEALILRHLHRLRTDQLRRLLAVCRGQVGGTDESVEVSLPIIHATCYEKPDWPQSVRGELESLFPCQVHLAGVPALKKDINSFVLDVVTDLNRRYGKRITEVESSVFDVVQRRAEWRTSLHELRSVLERAYFQEDTTCLSRRSMEAAACL
jgi:hypothetical protein